MLSDKARAKRDELDKMQNRVLQNYGMNKAAGFAMCLQAMWPMYEQERERSQKLVEALEFIFTSININGLDHAGDSIYLNERDVRDLTDAWNIFKEYEANR